MRINRLESQKAELTMQVNEVEQLRIMYSQFFKYNTAIQAELELHRNLNQRDISRLLKKSLYLTKDKETLGYREQKIVESLFEQKLASFYKTEQSVNCQGPGFVGNALSWWNPDIIDDDAQFRTNRTNLSDKDLFPMKDPQKYLLLGPAQLTQLHEFLLRQEVFNVPEQFQKIKSAFKSYHDEQEFEELMAQSQANGYMQRATVMGQYNHRVTYVSNGMSDIDEGITFKPQLSPMNKQYN